MTGCVLISPHEVSAPLIMGDTVVTVDGNADPEIAPARVRLDHNGLPQQGGLARKTFILNDAAAIAVAGDEAQICDFLEYAAATVEAAASGERPMRALGDRAGEYGGGVHVVGAFVRGREINYVRPEAHGTQEIGGIGLCSAIGSGAGDILKALGLLEAGPPEDLSVLRVSGGR